MYEHLHFHGHGFCLLWQPGLVWPTVLGDGVIALAYFAIPVLLSAFVRFDPRATRMLVWFMAFILLCGLTHVMDIITIWAPAYYVSAYLKVVTAIVSVGAAWDLWRVLTRLQQSYDHDLTVTEQAVILRVLSRFATGGAPHGAFR